MKSKKSNVPFKKTIEWLKNDKSDTVIIADVERVPNDKEYARKIQDVGNYVLKNNAIIFKGVDQMLQEFGLKGKIKTILILDE